MSAKNVLVMSPGVFSVSLIFVGLLALFGVIVLPFIGMVCLFWFLFRRRGLSG